MQITAVKHSIWISCISKFSLRESVIAPELSKLMKDKLGRLIIDSGSYLVSLFFTHSVDIK